VTDRRSLADSKDHASHGNDDDHPIKFSKTITAKRISDSKLQCYTPATVGRRKLNPSLSRTVIAEWQTRWRNNGLNPAEHSAAELLPTAAIWIFCTKFTIMDGKTFAALLAILLLQP